MNDYHLTELARRLENILRVGTVHAADYPRARVRVQSGDLITGWLPWLTARAGQDIDWWAPDIGEQVLVLSPSGDIANGLVLAAIYQTNAAAPEDTPDIRRIKFGDGTTLHYDRAGHHLRAHCVGDITLTNANTITIESGDALTVKAPKITLDAPACIVTGRLNVGNGMNVSGISGNGGAASFGGDVIAGGISLITHTHPGDSGGTTGAPQ